MHVTSYQECLECYRGASDWTADIMVFSYYQPLDSFGHSFCYVGTHYTDGEKKIMTVRHKICQNNHCQKL